MQDREEALLGITSRLHAMVRCGTSCLWLSAISISANMSKTATGDYYPFALPDFPIGDGGLALPVRSVMALSVTKDCRGLLPSSTPHIFVREWLC